MRLFCKYGEIKPRFYDSEKYPNLKRKDYEYGNEAKFAPHNNCKLFVKGDQVICWTEAGYFDVKTGKPVELTGNEKVVGLDLKDDFEINRIKRDDADWEFHPSYGLIQINHTSGRSKLFGSMLEDNHYITLRIKHAYKRDGEFKEEYFASRDNIVEVRMSNLQLADMLFNTNMNEGVPCTIAYSEMDGYIPEPPYTNYLDMFPDKFEKEMKVGTDGIDALMSKIRNDLTDKKTFSKAYVKEILNEIAKAKRTIDDSAPYKMQRFSEEMSKTRTAVAMEAQARINNQIENTIKSLIHSEDGQKLLEKTLVGIEDSE